MMWHEAAGRTWCNGEEDAIYRMPSDVTPDDINALIEAGVAVKYVPEIRSILATYTEDGLVGHSTCMNCGKRVNRYSKYCKHCGAVFTNSVCNPKEANMDKDKEQKQPSPFEQMATKIRERYAWYNGRDAEMMPYSAAYKIVDGIIDELNAAFMQSIEDLYEHYTTMVCDLSTRLDEANDTINLLTTHLRAANSTIKFEKRTRLELPRDAHGNRIYPDSKLERWGAIEDFWYCNGYWQVRGHDTSAPWLPADKVVVCEEGGQAIPEAKCPRGCSSRNEADQAVIAFCLGNISPLELSYLLHASDGAESEAAPVDLLFPRDDDESGEA